MAEELAKTYDPKGIEDRLYEKWMEKKTPKCRIFDWRGLNKSIPYESLAK